MSFFELGQYKVDIDVDRTRDFYEQASVISEGCTCAGCLNFESAVNTLPLEVRDFFTKIGVDLQKACEVYVNCGNDDGTLSYGGFLHICGTLCEGESAWIKKSETLSYLNEEMMFRVTDSFRISVQESCSRLEDDFPEPALQVEISADIPWVLEENNPYLFLGQISDGALRANEKNIVDWVKRILKRKNNNN